MKIEDYFNIIIESTGLTRKEIRGLLEDKKRELKGLISEKGALHIISIELGININSNNIEQFDQSKRVDPKIPLNMRNITLIGRVKEIYRKFSYNKKSGGWGEVGSFLLRSKTQDIRVVLWDNQVDILKNLDFKINKLVKIVNGYGKVGKFNNVEIHIGRQAKVDLNPGKVDEDEYPIIKPKMSLIRDINSSLRQVTVDGTIIQKYPPVDYNTKAGIIGQVLSIVLIDTTGSIKISFWNSMVKKCTHFNVGDIVKITDLNPRLDKIDLKSIELHSTPSSNVIILKKHKDIKSQKAEKITDLQDLTNRVIFDGIITSLYDLKTVKTKSGEKVYLLSLIVSDETDGIKVNIWREDAVKFSQILKAGLGISMINGYVKYSEFSTRKEVEFINDSDIKIVNINDTPDIKVFNEPVPKITGNYTRIESISSPGIVVIKGFIAREISNISFYEACPKCFKKINTCSCDSQENPINRVIINTIIDDGSGSIRCTFIGSVAEKLIDEKAENLLKFKEIRDVDKLLKEKSSKLLGKDIIIKGRIKFSSFSNSYELVAYYFVIDIVDIPVKVEGRITGETEKALLIIFDDGRENWFPKSAIKSRYNNRLNTKQTFLIDKWILDKNKVKL